MLAHEERLDRRDVLALVAWVDASPAQRREARRWLSTQGLMAGHEAQVACRVEHAYPGGLAGFLSDTTG